MSQLDAKESGSYSPLVLDSSAGMTNANEEQFPITSKRNFTILDHRSIDWLRLEGALKIM